MNRNSFSRIRKVSKNTLDLDKIHIEEVLVNETAILSEALNPVLLIPGGPGIDSSCFHTMVENLSEKNHYFLLDLPGNGSNKAEKTDFNQWKDVLANVLAKFDRPTIIAHSFASILLLSLPNLDKLVKKIILIGLGPGMTENLLNYWKKINAPDPSSALTEYQKNPSDENYKQLFLNDSLAFYYFCKPMEDVKEFLNHVPMAHEPYDWYVTSFMHECKTVLLPKIKTYLINGEKDYVTPPFLLDYIPNIHLNNIERFVISNAGHFPWMEQLEKTCILIDKVIDK